MSNQKLKICFSNSGFPPSKGGVATYSYEWVKHTALHPDVERVEVLAFGNKDRSKYRMEKRVMVRTFHTRNPILIGIIMFLYFIRFWNFNYFHATNLFPVGFWNVFWARLLKRYSIITFHGTDACSTKASAKALKLKRWSIDNADAAIAVSNFTKNKSKECLSYKKNDVKVIYAGVPVLDQNMAVNNINELKQRLGIRPKDFVILSIGQLVKRKGMDDLVKAIASIDLDNIKLIIVGDGPEKEYLHSLIKGLKCENRVILTGRVDNVAPYYSISHVFALCSHVLEQEGDFEGLGLVLLEAQSLSLPVIGTNSGGMPEAINAGVSGFVVPERNISAISEKVLQLSENKNMYTAMSKEAHEFVLKKFNWSNNIQEYINLIKK